MDKYYTPAIEEFHVGFEYEKWNTELQDFEPQTIKKVFQINNADVLLRAVGMQGIGWQIRVKYLDQEDIESFGFVLQRRAVDLWFEKKEFTMTPCGKYPIDQVNLNYGLHDHRLKIEVFYCGQSEGVLFEGIIKNISELGNLLRNKLKLI